ncbi:hypothetical protein LZ31DRAFT_560612 [Colletotrichum somersetense]|nr:hypothetical protein LZ31DRAFT_560612 [Colletotrichum somersetense]
MVGIAKTSEANPRAPRLATALVLHSIWPGCVSGIGSSWMISSLPEPFLTSDFQTPMSD